MELLGLEGNIFGMGVLQDNIKCGMELNTVKLCSFEVVVQVIQVLEELVWTREIIGEPLGQCVAFLYVGGELMYEVNRGGCLMLGNLVRDRTFLFRSL